MSAVPVWVEKEIEGFVRHRRTGGLTIMFSDGGIRNIHKEVEVIHPPKKDVDQQKQ